MSNDRQEWTIDVARPVIQQRVKQFEAAISDSPREGRIQPIGFQPWLASVYNDFQREPKLCQAAAQAPETVWECLMVAASCRLMPGAAAGSFYLIPRWNGKEQRMTCTFIVGYKGLAELAYRHPRVHKAEAFVVYKGEDFDFNPGEDKLVHRWRMDVERTDENIVAAYSKVTLTIPNGSHLDPTPLVRVMTRAEIEAIRKRSAAARSGFSPWTTDYAAMARKTPMRSHFNGGSVPRSTSLLMAINSEIAHEEKLLAEESAPQPVSVATSTLRQAAGLAPKLEEPNA